MTSPNRRHPPTQSPTHRLIVNADDFGESPLVNAAILQAHTQGILTSASLMVTGDGFDQAVQLAHATPGLRVGLHVTLLEDRPCLPPAAIPDLVDARGRFLANPLLASRQWLARPTVRHQIRREVRAQVERYLETGLPLDHLNGHFHFHIHPLIFATLLALIEEYDLPPRIRIPSQAPWLALGLDPSDLARKLGYIAKFNLPSFYYRSYLRKRQFLTIDGVLGLFQTGHLTAAYLSDLLKKIPPGTYELYGHPRLDRLDGLREVDAFTSASVRAVVDARNIQLTTYSQLEHPIPLGSRTNGSRGTISPNGSVLKRQRSRFSSES